MNFYPRSPCGERHLGAWKSCNVCDFYPRSPCGERRIHYDNYNLHCVISIHALLAESDMIREPATTGNDKFLSTLSLRRATTSSTVIVILRKNFYPRSPCGERHNINSSVNTADKISIHALLAESDPGKVSSVLPGLAFLSTLSLRRAT